MLRNTFIRPLAARQKLKLEEVSFTNAIPLLDDDGTALSMPQWKSRSFRNTEHPVCFVKKSIIRLSARITYKDVLDKDKVFIRAGSSNGLELASTKAIVDENKKEIHLPQTALNKELPDQVDMLEKMLITWQVSLDGGTTWARRARVKTGCT